MRLDRRQRYARSQADNVPKVVAGAKKRAAQVSAGKLRGGHEADVVEAAQTLRAAEDRVRDDEVITVDLTGTTVPAGREVLILEDVVLRNGRTLSFHLRGPERVAVTGANGSGKTTLIDTVTGVLAPWSGTVRALVPVRVLPQRLDLLPDAEPVLTAVARYAPTADDNTLRARLAGFLPGADAVRRPVGTLSGGERFRATLAALLLAEPPPQLLVMDEPTNSLDLDSVAQLVTALRQYRGALLVASHDEPLPGRDRHRPPTRAVGVAAEGPAPSNSRGAQLHTGARPGWSRTHRCGKLVRCCPDDATPATGGTFAARDENLLIRAQVTCGTGEDNSMSKLITEIDQASLRNDVPAFRPGDTVKVHVKVVEGNRSRIQVFTGVVIGRAGDGVRESFTVRKVSFGVGVERTFPVHSPIIDKIEVDRRGDVRRAKLYYLRGLRGKAAKIKEKRDAS